MIIYLNCSKPKSVVLYLTMWGRRANGSLRNKAVMLVRKENVRKCSMFSLLTSCLLVALLLCPLSSTTDSQFPL